jgi:hypothetical protein
MKHCPRVTPMTDDIVFSAFPYQAALAVNAKYLTSSNTWIPLESVSHSTTNCEYCGTRIFDSEHGCQACGAPPPREDTTCAPSPFATLTNWRM